MTTLFIDGDDTLWYTQRHYSEAIDLFVLFCLIRGQEEQEVRERFMAIDLARAEKYGFDNLQFGQSMFETLKELGIELTNENRRYVSFLGRGPFQFKPELIEQLGSSVDVTLAELAASDLRLVFYSSGHPAVQWRKLKQSGLEAYFANAVIIPNKNTKILEGLLETYHLAPSETWVVGNSLRSDINPAIATGCHAIYIPNGGWVYDSTQTTDRVYHELREFSRIPELLKASPWINQRVWKTPYSTSKAS